MPDAFDSMRMMRAVVYDRYGGPENLRVSSITIPAPAKDEVRVQVSACAVNLSDWEYLVGSPFYTRLIDGLFRPRSSVLGSDIVGVIDELGSDVTEFRVGQRIMGDFVMTRGGFAEYACVPARILGKATAGHDKIAHDALTHSEFSDIGAQFVDYAHDV